MPPLAHRSGHMTRLLATRLQIAGGPHSTAWRCGCRLPAARMARHGNVTSDCRWPAWHGMAMWLPIASSHCRMAWHGHAAARPTPG
eukprot:358148-Chlamydomonas_euryale.AAC.4